MKKTLLLPFLFLAIVAYGQSNYYKLLGEKTLLNEEGFNFRFKDMIRKLPADYSLTPIVYHKRKIQDSVINYVTFNKIWWGNLKMDSSKFKIVYKQDPLYLFLDSKLPEFNLKDLDGKIFNSSSLLGKPTLIDFWSKGCPGCILEMPELNKLKQKYNDKINFIAVSFDPQDTVIKFLKKNNFNFYHLVNGGNFAKNTLKITGIPRNIFLDKNGFVREVYSIMPGDPDNPKDLRISNKTFDRLLERLTKL